MSSSSKDIDKVDKRIDLLFSKFAAFYGHVWRSQFKDEVFLKFAKKEWQEALSEFTDDVLTKAVLNCREFYEMPPTLPQMLQCCKGARKQIPVNEQSKLDHLRAKLHLAQGSVRHFQRLAESMAETTRDQLEAIVKNCQMKVTQLEEEIRNISSSTRLT